MWAVFALDDPGRPHRILSLGEAKWDKAGYDMSATRLTCYSGVGFDPALHAVAAADPLVLLIGLDTLYGLTSA
jgi:hypothetical protein